MRIGPVAVRYAYDGAALAEAARESARVTLAHPLAVDSGAQGTADQGGAAAVPSHLIRARP
jgi:ADP-ribosylglycohydrolase